ncbi:hypothetical protein [Acrocarpospora sp. B8E8]|uniref:hypothetical protein n=1 Tax=Acrocarpospora sp. B8E8 TaxID=3153572 RepID=UPI00325E5054
MDPICYTACLDFWWRIQQFHYEAQVMGLHLGPLAVIATMTFLVSRRAVIAAWAGLMVLAVPGTIAAIANPYQFCYPAAMSPQAWPLIAAAILIRLPAHTTFLSRLTPSKNTRDLLAILAVAVILGWLVVAHFLP